MRDSAWPGGSASCTGPHGLSDRELTLRIFGFYRLSDTFGSQSAPSTNTGNTRAAGLPVTNVRSFQRTTCASSPAAYFCAITLSDTPLILAP